MLSRDRKQTTGIKLIFVNNKKNILETYFFPSLSKVSRNSIEPSLKNLVDKKGSHSELLRMTPLAKPKIIGTISDYGLPNLKISYSNL